MSVDKFGRYSEFGVKSGSHGKRGGLPLTSDGDYDMSNKRLKFVNDPQDDNDAINLKTLKSETLPTLKLKDETYNADSHRIINVGTPTNNLDSVNKKYLLSNSLTLNGVSYDANSKRITNVGNPEENTDCVTKEYLTSALSTSLRLDKNQYNAKQHRIVNLADPVNDGDSVTKSYLMSVIPSKSDQMFSFYNFAIKDVAYPETDTDAVNLKYIKDNCLIHDVGVIDGKSNKITNINEGSDPSDVVTVSQIMEAKNGQWDAKEKSITNAKRGSMPTDLAIVGQVPSTAFRYKHNENILTFDCKQVSLGYVERAEFGHEAVNLDQMKEWCIGRDDNNKNVYTCNNLRLTNLKDPESMNDAVNVNYIVRILGTMLFDFHNEIFDRSKLHNTVGEASKSKWINENIVEPYFINPKTKLFRTSNNKNILILSSI